MSFLLLAAHPIVHVNVVLNALAAVLLVAGLVMIKRGRVAAHKRLMLTAFAVSTAFLACYVWYHIQEDPVKFDRRGLASVVYYAVLITHIPLAFCIPFLALWTIYLGLRATGCCGQEGVQKGVQKGDSPLFATEEERRGDADPRKKGGVPEYVQRHRRLARWTLPIWLYVSVTGVAVYVMLYHLWPPGQ